MLLTSPFHPARATHLPRLRFACAFLTQLLANGDVPSPTIHVRARAAGVRRQALARDYLHMRIRKTGLHSGWTWSLPEP